MWWDERNGEKFVDSFMSFTMHKCKLGGNGSGSGSVQSLNFDFKLKFIKSSLTQCMCSQMKAQSVI